VLPRAAGLAPLYCVLSLKPFCCRLLPAGAFEPQDPFVELQELEARRLHQRMERPAWSEAPLEPADGISQESAERTFALDRLIHGSAPGSGRSGTGVISPAAGFVDRRARPWGPPEPSFSFWIPCLIGSIISAPNQPRSSGKVIRLRRRDEQDRRTGCHILEFLGHMGSEPSGVQLVFNLLDIDQQRRHSCVPQAGHDRERLTVTAGGIAPSR
jgi:hypothetical protein